ncbi:EF-hand calcium-binding domain-containing protein 6-like isoform X2 [Lepisosteus oculatus]|uniref:EF-hand calcium-binding domain-containing protein 6-like isoform X2 n=1 Tax=Lepisosteus oculatus TaxID=7918 RepID=UPI00371C586C
MPGSVVSVSLPNIHQSPLRAGGPPALRVRGENHVAGKGTTQDSVWNCGDVGLRASTAPAHVVHTRATWPPGNASKSVRANTALGRLSAELWPRKQHTVDEIIVLITEKLRSRLRSVQQLFRANDPNGDGRVSRLGLAGHNSISFEDFAACFPLRKKQQNEWFSPTTAKPPGYVQTERKPVDSHAEKMTSQDSERIWALIKERVHNRDFSVEKHLPSSCLQPGGMITAEQLQVFLTSMGLLVSEEEFSRLWAGIKKNGPEHISTDSLIRQLGINPQVKPVKSEQPCKSKTVWQRSTPALTDSSFEEIVTNLRAKLNESCLSVLHTFAQCDREKTGLVTRSAFRQALAQLSIPMGAIDLEHLLARFALRSTDGMVNYERLVEKLVSRSPLSMFNHNLESLKAGDCGGSQEGLTASQAETRLLELCHGLLLRLTAALRKADQVGDGNVRREHFKEILEKHFQLQLTEDQLGSVVSVIGDPESNLIPYNKFLLLFQERPSTSELKEEVERRSTLIHVRFDRLRYNESFRAEWCRFSHAQKMRPLQELLTLVQRLLQDKFRLFCKVFISVCNNDECTADKEKLDSILQKMNIILLPLELGKLWYSLPISYPAEAISLRKFVLYFSKMKKIKDMGPTEEDPVTLIQGKLRSRVVKQWRQIKAILRASDPGGSGKVTLRVIYALFLTLKFNIRPAEIDRLCQAFDLDSDGHFHYIPFLRFYISTDKDKQNSKSTA